jgi:hypothetical protein
MDFGQASGTLLCATLPSFECTIDWRASTDTTELILHGDYSDNELSDLQSLLYQHCRSPQLDALSQ